MNRKPPPAPAQPVSFEQRYSLVGDPEDRVQIQLLGMPVTEIRGIVARGIWQTFFSLLAVDRLRADAYIEGLVIGIGLANGGFVHMAQPMPDPNTATPDQPEE